MFIQPYLFFDGRCEEAMEFYRQTVGAQVTTVMRFKDNPEPAMNPPGSSDKVMHAAFRIGESEILASDGNCEGKAKFQCFSLTLSVANEAEADRAFNALSQGGQIQMPLGKTFFSPRFGMLTDRFGMSWMVIVGQ